MAPRFTEELQESVVWKLFANGKLEYTVNDVDDEATSIYFNKTHPLINNIPLFKSIIIFKKKRNVLAITYRHQILVRHKRFYANIFSSLRFLVTTVPGLCCASGWFIKSGEHVETGLLRMHCFKS